jgi:hypothetical protein
MDNDRPYKSHDYDDEENAADIEDADEKECEEEEEDEDGNKIGKS